MTFSFPTPSTLLYWGSVRPVIHPSPSLLLEPSFAAHLGTTAARANKQTEPRSDDDAAAASRKGSQMCVVFLPQRIPRPFSISDFCARTRDMPYKLMSCPPRHPAATHHVSDLAKMAPMTLLLLMMMMILLNSDRTGSVRKKIRTNRSVFRWDYAIKSCTYGSEMRPEGPPSNVL